MGGNVRNRAIVGSAFKHKPQPPKLEETLLGPVAPDMGQVTREAAKSQGYTGDQCDICGSARMRNNGTCKVCDDCGTTTGCS